MKDLCVFCEYAWPLCFKKGLWYTGTMFFILLSIRYGLKTRYLAGFIFGIVAPLFKSIWVILDADCNVETALYSASLVKDNNTSLHLLKSTKQLLSQYKRIESWLVFWILIVSLDAIWLLRTWIHKLLLFESSNLEEKLIELGFLSFGLFLAYTWT